jgi:hypothetical protein
MAGVDIICWINVPFDVGLDKLFVCKISDLSLNPIFKKDTALLL